MITPLLINIASQLFLIIVGLAILQLINIKNKVSFLYDMPYAFGVGVVFLYIVAFPFVRFEWFLHNWHLYIWLIGFVIIFVAIYFYLRASASIVKPINWQLKWYDWLLILFIISQLLLIIYVNLVHPVVDADATGNYRHIGLAKYIFMHHPLSETYAYKGYQSTMLAPPLLHAWSNMLQYRWYDSIATVHYIFFFIWILLLAGVAGIEQHLKPTFVILAILIVASMPLFGIHIIRPGYADVIVMLFFMVAITVLLSIINKQNIFIKDCILLFLAILGMMLTKFEGFIWALWVAIVFFSLYLYYYRNITFKTILTYQFILLIVSLILYVLTADWILKNVNLPVRVSFLFDLQYNPKSLNIYFSYLYSTGGQGLVWWIFSITSVLILIKSKVTLHKAIILYTIVLMLGLFHFANFTANVVFTLQGTNLGRFLLQISPLVLICYYLMLMQKNKF